MTDPLERLATRLAEAITPDSEPGPVPVQRRWGTIASVDAATGLYGVELADSGVTIPSVPSIAGAFTAGERCVVDFVGSDLMLTGRVEDRWHYVGAAGEPAFTNGWANWGDGTHANGRYRKLQGVVHLGGLISHPGSESNASAFSLPVGYRPSKVLIMVAVTADAYMEWQIGTSGEVYPRAITGTMSWNSLDALSFVAEQ